MSPLNGTQEYWYLHDKMDSGLEPGSGRSANQQAAIQIVALLVTFAVSIGGGLVTGNFLKFCILYELHIRNEACNDFKQSTGFIVKQPFFGNVSPEHLYDDRLSWEVPEAEQELPLNTVHEEEYTKETTVPLLTIPKFNNEMS